MKLILTGLLASTFLSVFCSAQIIVTTGDDLQNIVLNAPSGSVVEIQSDATFVGNIHLSFGKDITLQAGVGFSPTIEGFSLFPGGTGAPIHFTASGANVVLKGLNLVGVPVLPINSIDAIRVTLNGASPASGSLEVIDCEMWGDVHHSSGPPAATNTVAVSFVDSTGHGNLELFIMNDSVLDLTVKTCVFEGLLDVFSGAQNASSLLVRDSEFGGIEAGTVTPGELDITINDTIINGDIDFTLTGSRVDALMRRCQIFGTTAIEASSSPLTNSLILESCLLVGDGMLTGGIGARNSNVLSINEASMLLLNCTITNFQVAVSLTSLALAKNVLLYGNALDIGVGTLSGAVTTSFIEGGGFNGINGNFTGTVQLDADYSLLPCSLGFDAGGIATPVNIGPFDLYGNERIVDYDGDGIARLNVGAVERPGGTHASLTSFNGSGINPDDLTSTLPIIGHNVEASVVMPAGSLISVLAIDAPAFLPFQVPEWTGEILVAATAAVYLDISLGLHLIPVPFDCGLVGVTISAQGARFVTNGPLVEVILLNRVDYTIGF